MASSVLHPPRAGWPDFSVWRVALPSWGANGSGAFGNNSTVSSLTPNTPAAPLNGAIEELAVGNSTTCIRGGTQQLSCTGYNGYGQVGNGNTNNVSVWTASGLQTAAALPAGIAVGGYHSCEVVLADGSVRCVGQNYYGQLGDGTTTSRVTAAPVSGLLGVTAVATGGYFTCALSSAFSTPESRQLHARHPVGLERDREREAKHRHRFV